MLIVDVSEVKLPGEAKQNNLPPECGQPIDAGEFYPGIDTQRNHGFMPRPTDSQGWIYI
jgi:hypothetical protein